MTVYRLGATEKISSAAFLESTYATNATVTRHTTGATEATEVQKIALDTLTQSVYILTVGAVVLTTASLDASPTVAELVTAIQAATGYGSAGFTVAAGTGNQIVLTWDAAGAVTDVAALTKNGVSAGTTTLVRAGSGATEVQKVSSITLSQDVYVLRVGSTILTTASLDASPTIAELTSAVQAASGYGAAPFTVAQGTGNQLVLTWKTAGIVNDQAVLTVDGEVVGATTVYTEGTATAKKAQRIPVSPLGNYAYKLVVDSVTLTTNALGSSPTIQTLAAALKSDGDYAGAPFTITALYPDTLYIEWKVAQLETDSAVLTYDGASCGTTTVFTEGVTGVAEVQKFTPVLDASSTYKLVLGGVTLTTTALDATPTIAELNTALQADGDYAGAPFTTAVVGSEIRATWKTSVTVADVGTFEYKEYVEGPYSSVIPAGVAAIRVVCDAACNLKIGIDAEAGASDMLLPANVVETYKVSAGERVSFKGSSANLYVTYLYQ